MEQQVNKEVKQGWRFAVDAAWITDDDAGSEDYEDCKHTSGGVLVAIDCDVGAVIDKRRGRCFGRRWERRKRRGR